MFKNLFILVLIIFAVFSFLRLRTISESTYIDVKFEELEPVSKNIPVYLKGVKIGKVDKIRLTDTIDYSLVGLELNKLYKIPTGTKAKLKYDRLNKEYIKLETPEKPYKDYLKANAVIEGTVEKNLRKVLEEQIDKGTVDSVVSQASEGLDNIAQASDKINEAADLIVDIIKDNRPEINNIIKNFAKASEDTSFMISELRNSLQDPQVRADIKNMAKNLAQSAKNVKDTTSNPKINQSIDNVFEATKKLKSSSDKVDYLMCKTNNTFDKADTAFESVTFTSEGISDMLSKRFLIFRLMFGKPGEKMER